ncbi:MAG: hypothetical protein ABJH68_19145 [Ilumatobacter sp.]|uniref:hypothetical protein n=1 Tax=Ilumatobacter sp. TaxID=1967498 RepID=UPI00329A1E0C
MRERLDREAVDRILARAHRLENAASVADSGVEPEALIAAAEEVGIDPNAVRDSLAIERISIVAPPARRLDRLAGSTEVVVERDLHLTVDQTIGGIEAWLTSLHRLTCDRRSDGTLFARRRNDTSARIGRMMSASRGDGRLAASSLVVQAVAQTVGSTPTRPRTLVRISADRSGPRQTRLVGGGSLAGTGVAGGGVAALVLSGEALVAFPVVAVPLAVGGYFLARSGRGHADRLELELERVLSRVERGEQPTGLLGRMARRAQRTATGWR